MASAKDDLFTAAEGSFSTAFDGVIQLAPKDGAALWVDGRERPPRVTKAAPKDVADAGQCIWRASRETLIRIFEGERLLGSSYLSGRLHIAGDMSIMARLQLERAVRG